ncbi:MAG: DUF2784 domain-containing protein [Phycisphaeraceae bacterium]
MFHRVLADIVLLVHAGFIAFVVFGLLLILVGGMRRWQWVRNRWFRIAHLACIGIVVLQAWLGVACPLTVWENNLRAAAGETTYPGGFFAYWVRRAIFFDLPDVLFLLLYTAFGLLVVLTFWLVPVRWRGEAAAEAAQDA